MNTTTNIKHRLSSFASLSPFGRVATKTVRQVMRKQDAHSCSSRWPAQTKNIQTGSTVTTATANNYKNYYSNMKTLNTRKFAFVTVGFLAVVLLGTALVDVKGLAVAGEYVGYLAALAILALGALDNTGAKKLV